MPDDALSRMDACAQAELVRAGEISPTELVDQAIARIQAVDPQVNAVIHERFDRARRDAAGPLPDGPFRGVPFLLKDLDAPSAGDPLHCGAAFLRDAGHVAARDAYLTERFRRAGLVLLGRTNTPEFGTTITTEPAAYGPARNPWDLTRSTGGSSGGSAAAVASLMVPAAHASDGGGSIRIPAGACGLVGLKPTRGRVTMGPERGEAWAGATTNGVVTRSVRDTAALLDVIAGPAPGDPYVAPAPARPFLEEVGADPGVLRVGLLDRPALDGVAGHPDSAAAVAHAASLLERLGHRVEASHPAAMADGEFSHHFVAVLAASLAADLEEWERTMGRPLTQDDVEERNWLFAQVGRSMTAVQYLESVRWEHRWNRRMAAWWDEGFDLLCCPVVNGPPPPLGHLSDPVEGMARVTEAMQYTAQFNVTGQPAVSLPLWWNDDGLPVGVQLVAAFGGEDLLIRVAAQLEDAADWRPRVPPVHA